MCPSNDKEKRWSTIWSSFLYRARSHYIRMQQYKVLTRWYFTPLRLFHMKAQSNSLCWKGCGMVGSFNHCWWNCPVVQQFWKVIVYQSSKIVSLDIPISPEVILLDVWTKTQITGHTRDFLSLCFLVAKCIWAKYWKSNKIPTVRDWFVKLWDLAILDKLSEGILHSENPLYTPTFTERWFYFLGYIANIGLY